MTRLARWLTVLVGLACAVGHAQAKPEFDCGGEVEARVWRLWDDAGQAFLRDEMLGERLRKAGNTYALYDLQGYAHNLAAMAVRCGRHDRLEQLAVLVDGAYDLIAELPAPGGGRGWVCRGGPVCTAANRLINSEVALNSAQFLALALHVARGLAHAGPPSDAGARFVERSLDIALAHLERWERGADPMRLAPRLRATPASVTDASSRLFFSDKDLWVIDIHAEVAGLADAPRAPASARARAGRLREGVAGLLTLMHARTTIAEVDSSRIGRVATAEVDRGFWRLHKDSRYAGYDGPRTPARCAAPGKGPVKIEVPPDSVPVVESIGWDFSHARRWVYALDALERNRDAMIRVYGLSPRAVPDTRLSQRFAAQLVARIWNGDAERPLFANYWDGTNGWYRVAYDIAGTGCREGYAPYGLSDAFAIGGFATWARHFPVLGALGKRIYRLSCTDDAAAAAFIGEHYGGLGRRASTNNRMLTQLMFWPTLVATEGLTPKP